MTHHTEPAQDNRFLVMKRGLYFRPNDKGYTGLKREAGRYPASHACAGSGETAVHEDDATEYSPACWEETKLADKDRQIADLTAQLASRPTPTEAQSVSGEMALEIRTAVFEAVRAHHAAPALLRRDMLNDTLETATARIIDALTALNHSTEALSELQRLGQECDATEAREELASELMEEIGHLRPTDDCVIPGPLIVRILSALRSAPSRSGEVENKRLREALAPFAHAAFEAEGMPDEEAYTLVLRADDEEGEWEPGTPTESLITARQLRAARDAYNASSPKQSGQANCWVPVALSSAGPTEEEGE
jgi:hypothetical protein